MAEKNKKPELVHGMDVNREALKGKSLDELKKTGIYDHLDNKDQAYADLHKEVNGAPAPAAGKTGQSN